MTHREITEHIKRLAELGMPLYGYENWCLRNGFADTYDKTAAELDQELSHILVGFNARTAAQKAMRDDTRFLAASLAGDLDTDAIDRPVHKHMAQRLKAIGKALEGKPDDRADLLTCLGVIEKRAKFLFEEPPHYWSQGHYIDAVLRLWQRRGQWLQDLADWKPKSKNREKQFSHLLRFLLARYDVPDFMDSAWFRSDSGSYVFRNAWIHVAAGRNIRTARLPLKLTKRVAHALQSAPSNMSFEHALKWAQMRMANLSDSHIHAVLGTRWAADFSEPAFWESFLRMLEANPLLAPDQIGPVVDYIYAQKFEGPVVSVEDDHIIRDDPPHPGLSLRGRDINALLRQVEEWHISLVGTSTGRKNLVLDAVYPVSKLKGETYREKVNDNEYRYWSIHQITTQRDLHEEGRAMRHCIYSYDAICRTGRTSIWSLTVERKGGQHAHPSKRALTIDVSENRAIREVRGFANAAPEGPAWRKVVDWASQNDLIVSQYVTRLAEQA